MNKPLTEKSDQAQVIPEFVSKLVGKTIALVFTILVSLSLISHNPEDSHILANGLPDYAVVSNWIGLFGAHISRRLVLWIGFASYIGITVIFICVIRRVFSKHIKPVTKVYFGGIALFIWGCSMLLGNFPDFLWQSAERMNIAKIPGGVIGQRFCAPWSPGQAGGWLAYVVNQAGSVIISISMIAVGLITIWYYDWYDRARGWADAFLNWGKRRNTQEKTGTTLTSQIKKGLRRRKERIQENDPDFEANQEGISSAAGVNNQPESSPSSPSYKDRVRAVHSKTKNSMIPYKLPNVDLLNKSASKSSGASPQEIEMKKEILQDTLDSFSIDASVGDTTAGPRVTLFEIRPAPGVKVERISGLANNIAMNLKAESLRILTPIPGKDTVGIEVPNRTSSSVSIRDLIESPSWKKNQAGIPLVLGKTISGKPAILDLAKAPHLLIAGATGSGKSVCMNTLILSLLYRFSPEELKLIMVDPKVVEFSGYNSLPHLVTPVVTQVKKVPVVLRWVLNQMEWRYDILSKVGVRNLAGFNSRKPDNELITDDDGEPVPRTLPYLIVIIDELADIMMTAKADVETSLARIAQLARAVGIHVVVATQRPSVNVITGIIKANFPTRIAFQVTSVVDSRTILDGKGAETLLGRGDMLFKPPGGAKLERTQGAMVDDDEIERLVSFVSEQAQPEFMEDILSFGTAKGEGEELAGNISTADTIDGSGAIVSLQNSESVDGDEELIQKAIAVILRDRRATTSHIQRRLRIGYNRAALIIEKLEQKGVIGPQIGTAPRQILIDQDSQADDSKRVTESAP